PSRNPVLPKKRHRLRNFILFLTLFTASSFAGGVYYSLKSDNFHDFFTEYIPFGEDAVLYFEEKEFRKRFPNALSRAAPKPDATKVTIPQRSGATWKIHEPENITRTSDLGSEGPHIKSAGAVAKPKVQEPVKAEAVKAEPTNIAKPVQAIVVSEKALPPPKGSNVIEEILDTAPTAPKKVVADITVVVPRVHTPLLEASADADPVVHDLTKVVNNIIAAVNAPLKADAFDSAISSAKAELARLDEAIKLNKTQAESVIADKLKENELEFAKAAQGILARVDQEAEHINERYQEQLDQIRENILNAYREKLRTEIARTNDVAEARLKNELLEQQIEMKRKWVQEIKDRVEEERGGRLGKLNQLGESVKELETVISKWADVLQGNLKTQQLHVAVEAVRNVVDDPRQPCPFIRELAALKEVAEEDEVVRAAIASINPRAYQKGVYSSAQLTDRFRIVSNEVRKAALLPEGAGVAGHASSWLLSKLLFRKSGLATGDDVESILTRTKTYLEEGDLDNAAREMNQLQGWAKILARDWLKEARLLLEVKQALEVIGIQARLKALR
ncbi:mitochondrial inner membrane protein Mitofilin, partial [Peziza echinospora]